MSMFPISNGVVAALWRNGKPDNENDIFVRNLGLNLFETNLLSDDVSCRFLNDQTVQFLGPFFGRLLNDRLKQQKLSATFNIPILLVKDNLH